MMRYFVYLVIYLMLQVFTWIITPLLPFFAKSRLGLIDNANSTSIEPRLPVWLAWFDTPDNSLLGDNTWKQVHSNSYWSKVAWLYRNSLYGFKWTVLAASINVGRIFDGNTQINYKGPVFGTLKVTCGKYWQFKKVLPSRLFNGKCWVLNFGWLLDDVNQQKALFMFSPRLKRIKYE